MVRDRIREVSEIGKQQGDRDIDFCCSRTEKQFGTRGHSYEILMLLYFTKLHQTHVHLAQNFMPLFNIFNNKTDKLLQLIYQYIQ